MVQDNLGYIVEKTVVVGYAVACAGGCGDRVEFGRGSTTSVQVSLEGRGWRFDVGSRRWRCGGCGRAVDSGELTVDSGAEAAAKAAEEAAAAEAAAKAAEKEKGPKGKGKDGSTEMPGESGESLTITGSGESGVEGGGEGPG